MPFDVIGGDFAKGFGSISGNSLRLPKGRGGWSSESISTAMIRSVEEVSQQTTHHKAHRLSKSPSEKGLSDRDCCDSRGLRDLIWSYHVDPGHPAAA